MHKELALQYNTATMLEIAKAADFHANLIKNYGDDKRYAKVFGDLYLSILNVIELQNRE